MTDQEILDDALSWVKQEEKLAEDLLREIGENE